MTILLRPPEGFSWCFWSELTFLGASWRKLEADIGGWEACMDGEEAEE
jgi:hypothetical protein